MSLLLGIRPNCGVDRRGVVHAITIKDRSATLRSRRKTFTAACGHQRVRIIVQKAVNQDGNHCGDYAVSWPPRVSTLDEDGRTRCRRCWEVTGRPAPSDDWPRFPVRSTP